MPRLTLVKVPALDRIRCLEETGEGRTPECFRRREVIFSQGAPADALFYLQSGTVTLRVVSDQGKEAVVALLTAGDFFGEGCIGDQLVRAATATVVANCSVMRVEKATVMELLKQEPDFSEKLLRYMLRRASRTQEDLVDRLFNSGEKRLARVLLLLANFDEEGAPETVIARISQETLAEMIGITRSRVSFFMNKFRRLGYIRYKGRVQVDRSLLKVILE